ncbi:MAG: hypothetical protein AAFP77_23195 [Bacteroidota bacterium]
MNFQITLLLCVFAALQLSAQELIIFNNPSFEDTPRHSREPRGWTDCGPVTESPPDVQPDKTFQVTMPAYEGDTYLGMVTRDNNTWESIGTRLSASLQQDQCYGFQIALAQSGSYYSVSRALNVPANYISPVRLEIWVGNSPCELAELLVQTEAISHRDWRLYTFNLQPKNNSYSYLIFSVNYTDQFIKQTNGNLLLDAASDIIPNENCDVPETLNFRSEARLANRPLLVFLPEQDEIPSMETSTKLAVKNALTSIDFSYEEDEVVLEHDQFIVAGTTEIQNGSPFLYRLQHLLQYQPHQWELVIAEEDKSLCWQKITALEAGLSPNLGTEISVTAYDRKKYRKVDWYVKSIKKGFYLRRIED